MKFSVYGLTNQIVRVYPEPTLYLLTVFREEQELTHEAVDSISEQLNFVKRPHTIQCNDPFEVNSQIAKQASIDKTFEGYVIRDFKNVRFKLKSDEYLLLHRLSNNGNIVSIKNLVDIVLKGEEDEMVTYFPFIKDKIYEIKAKIQKIIEDLDNVWYTYSVEKSRKKFAERVKLHPFSAVLFSMYGKQYEEVSIKEELHKFKDKIVEYLEKK